MDSKQRHNSNQPNEATKACRRKFIKTGAAAAALGAFLCRGCRDRSLDARPGTVRFRSPVANHEHLISVPRAVHEFFRQ